MRKPRPDIIGIDWKGEGYCWGSEFELMETLRSYEVWHIKPPVLCKRFRKSEVKVMHDWELKK